MTVKSVIEFNADVRSNQKRKKEGKAPAADDLHPKVVNEQIYVALLNFARIGRSCKRINIL